MREYAALGRDVIVVGVSDRLELWESAAWTSVSQEADDAYADISDALSEEGI